MADKKITALVELAVTPADDDMFTLVDVSEALDANKNKKISYATLKGAIVPTVSWLLDGNTVGSEKYIGTDDNFRFPIRVNNVEAISIETNRSIKRDGVLFSIPYSTLHTSWGNNALAANTAVVDGNSAFGNEALLTNTTGYDNSAFGLSALRLNLTGVGNAAFGNNALELVSTGQLNAAFGNNSGLNALSNYNCFFGASSGYGLTTGQGSVYIGFESHPVAGSGTLSFSIGLGYKSEVTASNQLVIGSAIDSAHVNQNQQYYSATGIHGIYFRTSTPEGAQAATRGSKAFVDNASIGIEYVKHNGTGNTGWKTYPLIYDKSVTDAAHTGDTNETKKYSVLIPANTLIAGSQIRVLARCKKTGTAGTNRFRFRIGTADDLTGNIVADTNMAATVLYAQTTRQILVKSTAAVEVFNTGVTNSPDDCTVSATALSSVAVDTTVANYFVISVQLGNSADTATFSGYYLEILY